MRRIKKTLCLTLVLALALGMLPAMSAVAEWEDVDDIDQIDAASVLNALSIMTGDDAGFRPKDRLNRAEACAIVVRTVIGRNLANALTGTGSEFTDLRGYRWADGVIAYAVSEGITIGTGGGRFSPGRDVTGIEFAAMLLRALGKGTYAGEGWQNNVIRDAIRYDIFPNDNTNFSLPATREQAALYAFNALFVDAETTKVSQFTIRTNVEGHILNGTNYSSAGAAMAAGGAAGTGLTYVASLTGASAGSFTIEDTSYDDKSGGLAERVFGMSTEPTFDAFMRPATDYIIGSNTIHTKIDTPVLSTDASVNRSAIRSALGITASGDTNVPIFIDGVQDGTVALAASGGNAGALAQSGNGARVEVYGGSSRRIVVVYTYVGIVTGVTTTGTRAISVSNPNANADATGIEFTGYNTTGFARDNVVLYQWSKKASLHESATNANARVQSIKEAREVLEVRVSTSTGAVTANNANGTFSAGGQRYTFSKFNFVNNALNVANTDFDLYLDDFNHVVLARQSRPAALTELLYVRALMLGEQALFANERAVWAQVVFDDGKTANIRTNMRAYAASGTINDNTPIFIGNTATDYTAGLGDADGSTNNSARQAFSQAPIAFYTENNEVYTLRIALGDAIPGHVGTNYVQTTSSNMGFARGSISFTGNGTTVTTTAALTSYFSNAATRFIVGSFTGSFSTYTGNASVPTVTAGSGTGAILRVGNRAAVVFASSGTIDAGTTAAVFLVGAGRSDGFNAEFGSDSRNYYRYNAVVAGELADDKDHEFPGEDEATGKLFTRTGFNIPVNSYRMSSTIGRDGDEVVNLLDTGSAYLVSGLPTVSSRLSNNVIVLTEGDVGATTYEGPYLVAANAKVFLIASNGIITEGERNDLALADAEGRHIAFSINNSTITEVYYFNYDKTSVGTTFALTIAGFTVPVIGQAVPAAGSEARTISAPTGIPSGVTVLASGLIGTPTAAGTNWAAADTIAFNITLDITNTATHFFTATPATPAITLVSSDTAAANAGWAIASVTRVNQYQITFTLTYTVPAG